MLPPNIRTWKVQSQYTIQQTPAVIAGATKLLDYEQNLPAQLELLQDVLVARRIALVEVVEETAALAYHLQQTTARMLVFFVSLEVLGEQLNLFSKNPNLNFRRTGVSLVGL